MKNMKIVFLGVVLSSALGCSTSDKPPAATNDTGVSTDTAALCLSACGVAKTCAASLDESACQAQCAKEIAGGGYFNASFAKEFMTKLAAAKSDATCEISRRLAAWSTPLSLEDQGVKDCIAYAKQCDLGDAAQKCFSHYYAWNDTTRAHVKACFTIPIPSGSPPCVAVDDCLRVKLDDTALSAGSAPWLAMPCDPQPLLGDCPTK